MINRVIVVGSLNMDLVAQTPRIPDIGETILGRKLSKIPGGKGANQAVSSSLMGAETWMLGKIGPDDYGQVLKRNLKKYGIKADFLIEDPSSHTGTAVISVDDQGNNSIIVIPGANGELKEADIEVFRDKFNQFDTMLLQLEIPSPTAFRAIKLGYEQGLKVVLDPAPVTGIPEESYGMIDIIKPNATEAEQLTGYRISDEESYHLVGDYFLERGVKIVLLTLGKNGVFVKTAQESFFVKAYKVKAIDTTAAGDCFTGAFAACFKGNNLQEAVQFANAAAALSTTRVGAQSSLPTREEVNKFLSDQKGVII